MDIKWLEDFIALVDHGSYTKAAEVRFITQSGFSRRIRSLESSLGVELVEKNVYPTTLTSIGLASVDSMRLLLTQYYSLQVQVLETNKSDRMLTFVTQHALSIYFFPEWYRRIKPNEDCLGARMIAKDFHSCLVAFLEERCDFLLSYDATNVCDELTRSDIRAIQVGVDKLIPVISPYLDGSVTFGEGLPIPTVGYPDDTYFGQLLRDALDKIKLESSLTFDLIVETAMVSSIKSMVIQGLGIGWLPKAMVEDELRSGKLVQVDNVPTIDLKVILYRHHAKASEGVELLWRNALMDLI